MAKKPQRAALLKQMQSIQSQLAEVAAQEDAKAGKLARKSGLLELDLTDAQLLEGMKELAARFRQSADQTPTANSTGKD